MWAAEGQDAGFDLLKLLGAVHAGIARLRAQFRHRAQQDLRCRPGERHIAIRPVLGAVPAAWSWGGRSMVLPSKIK